MRAAERETEQVPSALFQKFRLKINIAAYGGVAGVSVALGQRSSIDGLHATSGPPICGP